MSTALKLWLVGRLWRQFPTITEGQAFRRSHAAQLLEMAVDADGGASVWAIEYHCERGSSAHNKLDELADAGVPGMFMVLYVQGATLT